jgi:hypothetical protein
VGKAVGVSGKTYEKAKHVTEAAAEDSERFGDLPAKMGTESMDAAYKELKNRRKSGSAVAGSAFHNSNPLNERDPRSCNRCGTPRTRADRVALVAVISS